MIENILEYASYLIILVVIAYPLGSYITKVMEGQKTVFSRFLVPLENFIYKILHIQKDEMNFKKYTKSIILFSLFSFLFLFVLQLIQGFLPGNPEQLGNVSWDLSFNTAISFITNTNWQAYSGESTLSYLTQALGLTVQNFLSAAVGISVLFALIRGFCRVKQQGIGNFWVDMIRSVVHLLLPLNIVLTILLMSGGVVQSLAPSTSVSLLEPIAIDSSGQILEEATIDLEKEIVIVDGKQVKDAKIIKEQYIPRGAAASQIAIKQSGTNGGGFFGVNSAHPFENPNAFTNMIEMLSILLIPVALCFSFGKSIKNKKQGIAIFASMAICLVVALAAIAVSEQRATPQLSQDNVVDISMHEQAGGNMEGKEARFGIVSSSTWAAFTTAASSGSVNSMHDSYTPIGGMVTMILMQVGEVIFGGVGCGLYSMLAFAILTVFIAGLMVGRTPEFLGKKIDPYEMKWAVMIAIATPIAILCGSTIASLIPQVADSVSNEGAHGFSQLLYAFTSCGGNNGSAFAGFNANTPFLNVLLGIVMLFARFMPMIGTIAIASSLANKKKIVSSAGTLSTTNMMFVFLLIFVVILIGALSFLPALSLGPIAEFLQSIV